jgi:prephenate dehydrogenase
MRTVAIAGVGLIGGSLGLALRAAGFTGRILGVSSPRTIGQAVEAGAIDEGASLEEAAAAADLLYLAQPVQVILDTIDRLGPILRPDCLVTDAGSTKVQIIERARAKLPGGQFLGGHPMAGKESRGIRSADAGLFRNRTYAFVPVQYGDLSTPLASGFIKWVERCGAIPLVLEPEEHDRTVAFTSHLPQLLSTALGSTIQQQLDRDEQFSLSGPALREALRLARSDWAVWRDILETNSEYITHALTVYIDKLTEIRDNLQTLRLEQEWTAASVAAERLRRQGSSLHNEKEGK